MKNLIEKFRITDGDKFSLKDYNTSYSGDLKKEDAEDSLQEMIEETAKLQATLNADKRYAILILFQAMDAAGKDGAIAHTMSGLNPQGCDVHSFKEPSAEELDHDFLWRHYKALPEFGRIGVHNRSHYENLLVSKVHPELLLKERLPGLKSVKDADKKFWDRRYESIRSFEDHLYHNGTIMIKFFLHLSKNEQRERFLKRIDDPQKNWKFSATDIEERRYWHDYMDAYQKAIVETSTAHCPWYVIPADRKWFTRTVVSAIILDTLTGLKLKYPHLSKAGKEELEHAKKLLEK